MLEMNRCLLIATSLLYGVLAVDAYCSCKCNTPEIPYTRVSYVPQVPHIPYKYTPVPAEFAHVAVNPHLHEPVPVQSNHQSNYVPIVIIPQISDHFPLHGAPARNNLVLQRKELTLQDVGQASHLQHVQLSSQGSAPAAHPVLFSSSHGETSTTAHGGAISNQHLIRLDHDQAYRDIQTGTGSQHHQPGHHGGSYHEGHHEKDHNVNYKYEYAVNDHKTGDLKRHQEERHGDDVVGEYSLVEDDGNVRTVKYRADWKTGFHAQVHNSKPRQHQG